MQKQGPEYESGSAGRFASASNGFAERHAALLHGSVDAIIGTNLCGVITSWSPGAQRLFGYKPDEMIGDSMTRLVPTQWWTAEADIMDRIARGTTVGQFDTERVRKDHSLVAVSRTVLPILDHTGNVIGAYDVSHDLSRFHELEQALRESETRFHEIFDNMLEGCQVHDRSGRFLYVNESLTRQCRVPRERMIGRTMEEVFPDFARGETYASFERCLKERRPARCEARYTYADGSYGWFDLSIQPASEGLFCLSVDITERKRAEEALAASEKRFHQLTESLPLLVWTATADGTCDYLGPQWEAYTGDASVARWSAAIHPDDLEAIQTAWQASVDEERDFRAECRVRRHDESYRWFDCRGTPLRDEHGVVTKWIGTSVDIDDVRHAQLVELHKHKLESLGTLASGIAHDFNNILSAILGNTELAVRRLAPGHGVLTLLSEIQRASLRARDVVRRILAFSRRDDPKREPIGLPSVVEEAVAFLRPTLPAKIELSFHCLDVIPAVLGDATQTHQVIMNLVANAVHAIGPSVGRIMLELTVLRIDGMLATTTGHLSEGTYVRLTVRDDGCGMDARTVKHIFDPFFTTKGVGEGTGLGLSVVANIMNRPGNAIHVRSAPGQGSAFELYFPTLRNQLVSARPSPLDVEPAVGRGQRVLYVDDDEMLVRMQTRLLESLGYGAVGCAHAVKALARFREHPDEFDAVITDLSMPQMSGIELGREMLLLRPGLPLILVSGTLDTKETTQARRLGFGAFLSKPFTAEAMAAALGRLLTSKDVHPAPS